MKEQEATVDPWDLDDPSVEQSLADDNLQSQGTLWDLLNKARQESGRSDEDVARLLNVPLELLEAVEGGRVNVTLSDLREYAYAIDALISYRVVSRYSEKLEAHRTDITQKPWHDKLPGDVKRTGDSRRLAMWARNHTQ